MIQFNACDQFQVDSDDDPGCFGTTAVQRANAIVNYIDTFPADVVALQEVCKTTVIEMQGQLNGWSQYFVNTAPHPTLERIGASRSSRVVPHLRPSRRTPS